MICNVYVFQNGMVAVFDEHGEQLQQYQGVWKEKREKILTDAPPSAEFVNAIWGKSFTVVKREEL